MVKTGGTKDYFPRDGEEPEIGADQAEFNRKLTQLYESPAEDWLSEDEIKQASLKQIAEADALRAYGWFRQRLLRLTKFRQTARRSLGRVLDRKGVKMALVGVVGLVLIGGVTLAVIDRASDGEGGVLGTDNISTPPDFTTLTPTEGFDQSRFDSRLRVATFQDELSGGVITISQQPLPSDVANTPDGVSKLALSLEDKQTIDKVVTLKGIAYIARTATGRQTVIFSHQDLLIFITAAHLVTNQGWTDYINSLQ